MGLIYKYQTGNKLKFIEIDKALDNYKKELSNIAMKNNNKSGFWDIGTRDINKLKSLKGGLKESDYIAKATSLINNLNNLKIKDGY
jgi:hypothetical protein